MTTVVLPRIGDTFTFREHSRWQFWRRKAGVGRLLGLDEAIGVAHEAVFGHGSSQIQHIPILASRLASSILDTYKSEAFDPQPTCPQINQWRVQNAADEAGAFSIPL